MNKEAIYKTAVCRWEKTEACFVVSSPLFENLLGAGETAKEAWQLFHELLDELYQDYLEGNLAGYDKPGRPAKNKERLHTKINPNIREDLDKTAEEMHCSTGEVIEYLWAFRESLKDVDPQILSDLLKRKSS